MVESKFQTSFIPKKPIEQSSSSASRRAAPSLLRLIAMLILFISLVSWGGVFLWKVYLTNKIQNDTESLQNSQKEFDLNTVNTLTRLDNRLKASESLLNNHLSMSKLFDELQTITLKNVRFNDFNLSYTGVNNNSLTLTLKGQALGYADVAAQSDVLDQNTDFKSPIFSNLDLDSTGKVIFSVTTGLDSKNFLYTNGAVIGAPAATPEASSTSNTNPFNQ